MAVRRGLYRLLGHVVCWKWTNQERGYKEVGGDKPAGQWGVFFYGALLAAESFAVDRPIVVLVTESGRGVMCK